MRPTGELFTRLIAHVLCALVAHFHSAETLHQQVKLIWKNRQIEFLLIVLLVLARNKTFGSLDGVRALAPVGRFCPIDNKVSVAIGISRKFRSCDRAGKL